MRREMMDPVNKVPGDDPLDRVEQHISTSSSLGDEQRIKVLSPYMLVFKRFVRNMLAIVGVVCISTMFVFSFIGGWLGPYSQSQIFTEDVDMSKAYAGVTQNLDYRFTEKDDMSFPLSARAMFVKAVGEGSATMASDGDTYSLKNLSQDFYLISKMVKAATAGGTVNKPIITYGDGFTGSQTFEDAFKAALTASADHFSSDGVDYSIAKDKKFYAAYVESEVAVSSLHVFDYVNDNIKDTFDFKYQAETAMSKGNGTVFTVAGINYEIDLSDEIARIYQIDGKDKIEYAIVSTQIVQAIQPDVFLSIEFKDAVRAAIMEKQPSFTFTDDAGQAEYQILQDNTQYLIKKDANTQIVKHYEGPSKSHWLGTDGNGMDIITRLMYGGRISLMIGFIVVAIESFIGIILGGLSGYFGKWIDNLLMRIVDVFNCIPSIPLIIILGAVMDAMRLNPNIRMVYLMLILGILGWPGIARMVRGQILSLREQEFMVAAEATGLSVYRKIFKHLIPNVIPQLIVIATMSLGDTILIESTLSFLGLGVKFPFASWGNIINAVSNVHVMTNYWFVWIPAGFCILITVLAFNFIGDGLRDAFDPKMKR